MTGSCRNLAIRAFSLWTTKSQSDLPETDRKPAHLNTSLSWEAVFGVHTAYPDSVCLSPVTVPYFLMKFSSPPLSSVLLQGGRHRGYLTNDGCTNSCLVGFDRETEARQNAPPAWVPPRMGSLAEAGLPVQLGKLIPSLWTENAWEASAFPSSKSGK